METNYTFEIDNNNEIIIKFEELEPTQEENE